MQSPGIQNVLKKNNISPRGLSATKLTSEKNLDYGSTRKHLCVRTFWWPSQVCLRFMLLICFAILCLLCVLADQSPKIDAGGHCECLLSGPRMAWGLFTKTWNQPPYKTFKKAGFFTVPQKGSK